MLMEQQERIGNEQAEAERAKAELAALEAKIMHGGEHVRDRVTRQQQEIEAREREIVKQQEAERQAMQEHRRKEEERLAVEERYSSLEEEAAAVGKKLKQLWAKFRAAQSEIADLKDEQQQEKEDLLHAVRELTRQLQLQNIVIENFIPKDEVEKLERRARWDEVTGRHCCHHRRHHHHHHRRHLHLTSTSSTLRTAPRSGGCCRSRRRAPTSRASGGRSATSS